MSLLNEKNTNQDIENILSSFMDEIEQCKDELSSLEKKYDTLLSEQEEETKKINYFSNMILGSSKN